MATPKSIFLTATYVTKPRYRDQTYVSGYMNLPNSIQHDEVIDVTRGLKDRDLMQAKIILDITNQAVIKNSFDVDKTKGFMELFQYFYTNSPQEISQALRQVGITIESPAQDMPQEVVEVESLPEVAEIIEPVQV